MFTFTLVCMKMIWDTAMHVGSEVYQTFLHYNQVVIDSATVFRETKGKVSTTKRDITWHVKKHLESSSFFDVPLEDVKIEIRYRLNGKKYRMYSSARLQLPYTYGMPRKFVRAIDVDTGDDYSERIAKYAGPWFDFHGQKYIYLSDLFPSWHPNEVPKTLKIQIFQGSNHSEPEEEQIVTHTRPFVTRSRFLETDHEGSFLKN